MSYTIIKNKKGHLRLLEGGFIYFRCFETNGGEVYWKCREYVTNIKCPAEVKTNGNRIEYRYGHNHKGNVAVVELEKLCAGICETETNTTDTQGPPRSGSRNTFSWRCREYYQSRCPARLETNGDEIVFRFNEHNHPWNVATKEYDDEEICKTATSATVTPKPPRSGSQNEQSAEKKYYGPSEITNPMADAEVTSSHVSHTTYAQRPGQTSADDDDRAVADACEDAQIIFEGKTSKEFSDYGITFFDL